VIRLGIIGHRAYEGLGEVVRTIFRLTGELDLHPMVEPDLADVAPGASRLEAETEIDAIVTLGGDGTLLRGARLLAGRPVPILGINLGRLGFLTSCGRDEAELALRRLAAGDYLAERRMQLEARALDRAGASRKRWFALNDVVLHKGGFARVLHLSVSANGRSSCRRWNRSALRRSHPIRSRSAPSCLPRIQSFVCTQMTAPTNCS
jgi:NAD+ kinase